MLTGPTYPSQPGPDDYSKQNSGQQYGGGQYPPPPSYGGYPGAGAYNQPPASPRNGLGIAALVLGILSILGFWSFGLGIVLGVVAVILGVIGRSRVKRREATNGGVATTGIVLGVLGIVAGALFIVLSVWVFNEVGGRDLVSCVSDAGGDQSAIEQCQREFESNLDTGTR